MKSRLTYSIKLQKSEGLCWTDSNPFLIINLVAEFERNLYQIRVKKHIITNELIFEQTLNFNKFNNIVKNKLNQQEHLYIKHNNKLYNYINNTFELILAANENSWSPFIIDIEFEI